MFKKYDWVLKSKEYNIFIRKNEDLLNEIYKNDIIVGCNTIAMYLGILAKKKVYTSIPRGYSCDIPSKKIHYLNEI